MMCKLKGRIDKEGHSDVEMKWWMQKGIIIMCKLKGQMDNQGHYDVQMKGEWKRWHYDLQIKRVDA